MLARKSAARWGLVGSLIIVGAVFIAGATTGWPASGGGSVGGTTISPTLPSSSDGHALLSMTDISGVVSDEYSRLQAAHSDLSRLPTQPAVDERIAGLFLRVQANPAFAQALAISPGASFNLQLRSGTSVGISDAYFSVNWASGDSVHTAYWDGDLSTGGLRGPVLETHRAAYNPPPSSKSPPATKSATNSNNWAGSEFYNVICYRLCTASGLYLETADTKVTTIAVPPQNPANVPTGTFVHAVASVWTALSGGAGGANGLMQTGYLTDATSPTWYDYTYFYEFYPQPLYTWAGAPHTKPGDIVTEYVHYNSRVGTWVLEVADDTTGLAYTTTMNPSGFSPRYAEFITEAYTYTEGGTGVVQQIAAFSNPPTDFEDGWIEAGTGSIYTLTTLYNNGWDNIYQLSQFCSFWFLGICLILGSNTNQNYIFQNGYYGGYGYPEVSWVTSQFDYNIAH